ncbi:GntR family transcriptional regulator [Marinomonas sp. GJ51-6]|uniref:GntR family transcriptional regulator n=1 Tax=Marinomonas sp. GJ51-6 TaxID=2992802 RepID=UPI0029349BA0|nr:GntR family transcriptional regulator [Marinomonas sp. GJ51-6]WOD07515.1 GntR family transcriptional regulator [Marinomonas sp. GJ51-6]
MDVDIIQNSTGSITKTAIDRVYQELRQKIIKGEFSPGERLKVETLKPLFDTGASPIREALSLLTSNKLVTELTKKALEYLRLVKLILMKYLCYVVNWKI